MIDYLLTFASEDDAIKACPDMRTPDGADWNRSFVIPDVKVFKRDAEARDLAPGYYLWLSTVGRQAAIETEAWCILGTERDTRKVVHSRLSLDTLSALNIEPVYCGCDYKFGVAKTVGVDVETVAIKADARALTFQKAQAKLVAAPLEEIAQS